MRRPSGITYIARCRIRDQEVLRPDETYAVTAFILYLNGIVDEKAELNEVTLPRVKMPNRDGFVGDPRPDVPTRKVDK